MHSPLKVSERPQLAIFGAEPTFNELLHVGRPNVGDRQRLLERIQDVVDRRWLTNEGPYVEEFERRLEAYLGVRNCIAMCNGTVALEIVTRAVGLTGEVIVPSFTFIATAHALQWQQVTPVFCDIDPRTHTIAAERVEELITPRTTGIIGVHTWGHPCDVESLSEIATRRGLTLLFDAAHAFGCSHGKRRIGGFGRAEVFSFHATKFVNSFEGGAVVTNDDALAHKVRLMKNFGFVAEDAVGHIGTNGKLSEVSAAMGLTSLEAVDSFIEVNRRNYHAYARELSEIPGLRLLQYDESEDVNYQYIVVEVDDDTAGLTRNELIAVLLLENVRARRYFFPGCHGMEPYRSLFPHARLLLPNTEAIGRRVMVLPTGTAVDVASIEKICEILRTAIANACGVRSLLATMRMRQRTREELYPSQPPPKLRMSADSGRRGTIAAKRRPGESE